MPRAWHSLTRAPAKRVEVRAPLPSDLRDYVEALGSAAKADCTLIDALLREYL